MTKAKIDPTVGQEKETNPRHDLHDKMEALKGEISNNLYLDAVYEVNKILIEQEKPMGPNMVTAVDQNLEEIRSGTGSLPTYHAREVGAMVKDGASELMKGNYEQAALNGAGAAVNTMAFFVSASYQASQHKIGRSVHDNYSNDDSSPQSSDSGCLIM
ncbi:hypothetical protein EP47_08810 [Legionella norrlandica]|uniref:Uncharacterized protein n=1 Tax=Legionella norrlandica TaxID=1498499 RepID=A0A0A2SN47_9GAMM|nr:hypothetical protein [Legionella norrlandica]KGP62172.1 hypothetical protein EP47_08810 [Legionella norrlandica]